jgi:hypothetical protein
MAASPSFWFRGHSIAPMIADNSENDPVQELYLRSTEARWHEAPNPCHFVAILAVP